MNQLLTHPNRWSKRLSIAATLVAAALVGSIAGQGKIDIGMNGSPPSYFRYRVFVDYGRQTKEWCFQPVGGSGCQEDAYRFVETDENGYPLELPCTAPGYPEMFVNKVLPGFFEEGEYVLLYDGEATIDFYEAGYIDVLSIEPGRAHFRAWPKGESGNFAALRVRSTPRGNHFRNLRILPIELEHTYDPDTSDVWDTTFLETMNCLTGYRYMGWTNINDGGDHWEWEKTPRWGYHTACTKQGVPYDYQIDLANRLQHDPWFNIPHMVDDNYIYNLAVLIKEKLDPGLTAYIEYSNELWNWGGAYPQSSWIVDAGRMREHPEWDAPDSIHQALQAIKDGPGDFPEMGAYMFQRVFNIFRTVFTGPDEGRAKYVYANQLSWYGNANRGLDFLYNRSGDWGQWSTGGGCDYVAVAPYLRNPAVEPDDLEKRKGYFRELKTIAESYGVEIVCYEGGTQNNQGALWQRSQDCYDVYNGFLHFLADTIGVNVFYALDLIGDPDQFGHIDSLQQASMDPSQQPAKWRAIMDINTRQPIDLFSGTSHALARTYDCAPVTRAARQSRLNLAGLPIGWAGGMPVFDITGRLLHRASSRRPMRGASGVYVVAPQSPRER
ncbi:MAG: hypothetical protein GF331_01465 [Chitinivibrionales bacterium]|nr:hypothetical protein [Chitinivibrionales bacterium]